MGDGRLAGAAGDRLGQRHLPRVQDQLAAADDGFGLPHPQGPRHRFNDEEATIDTTVAPAKQIMRLPGTLNCKGQNTPKRPHRLSRILKVPSRGLTTVPTVLLEKIAAEGATTKESAKDSPGVSEAVRDAQHVPGQDAAGRPRPKRLAGCPHGRQGDRGGVRTSPTTPRSRGNCCSTTTRAASPHGRRRNTRT